MSRTTLGVLGALWVWAGCAGAAPEEPKPGPPSPVDAGRREPPCPQGCLGCCRDGVCLPGTWDSACGLGGERCKVCPQAAVCQANGLCWVGGIPADPGDAGTAGPVPPELSNCEVEYSVSMGRPTVSWGCR